MARVLLVEDDELQLEVRTRLLELAGHEVHGASTREEAQTQVDSCQVMVTDLIPGSTDLLNSAPPGLRVIVLTGREGPPASLRADRFLRKPCPTADLLAAIQQLC
jgi:CheY-like chemotaxis protein